MSPAKVMLVVALVSCWPIAMLVFRWWYDRRFARGWYMPSEVEQELAALRDDMQNAVYGISRQLTASGRFFSFRDGRVYLCDRNLRPGFVVEAELVGADGAGPITELPREGSAAIKVEPVELIPVEDVA